MSASDVLRTVKYGFFGTPAPLLRLAQFFFILCFALPAAAQEINRPTSPGGWSELIHRQYQSIKSLHATFEQSIMHKESGIEEQRTGEFFFKKPFLVRWVSEDPYPELLLVEEKFFWQFLPEEKLVLKFKVESLYEQVGFLSVLTGQAPLTDKFKVVPKEESEGVRAIMLLPHSPSPGLVEATIWVDTENGVILRLLFTDFYGNSNDISFTNQELDVNISSETFKFTPPPGTTVEDHTQPQPR
ncbi:MAG: outer membrane lipoprotein carrier protein LolA [Deltaproteobacteria bacterium]|jgi:outer membrane lipoprotein carrier protein|nr:outer membrane lipoprotein carrier protein LolA [Deltaproteobacteria bacterium]